MPRSSDPIQILLDLPVGNLLGITQPLISLGLRILFAESFSKDFLHPAAVLKQCDRFPQVLRQILDTLFLLIRLGKRKVRSFCRIDLLLDSGTNMVETAQMVLMLLYDSV